MQDGSRGVLGGHRPTELRGRRTASLVAAFGLLGRLGRALHRQVPSASKFYQPVEFLDPFGNSTTVEYDADSLFILEVEDPVGNTVTAEVDLRVLAPWKLTDANGNRVAVGFDTRGVVVKSAIMGKDGANEGDTLTAPTSMFEYDLFAWKNEQKPLWVKTRARETHADVNTRWLESYAYFDGAGRTRMTKVQAAPGLAPQRDVNGELVLDEQGDPVLVDTTTDVLWIGTGRTVFDNKGNPVKQYELYFSSIPGYEDEAELVEQGVTPVLHYDPLGRLVRTELPNGRESRVEFDGWTQVSHDPNDLVEGSAWYTSRIGYNGADEGLLAEKRAAGLAYAHRDTPTTTHLDPQGRPFRVEQHNGFDGGNPVLYATTSILDVQGNVLRVYDARARRSGCSCSAGRPNRIAGTRFRPPMGAERPRPLPYHRHKAGEFVGARSRSGRRGVGAGPVMDVDDALADDVRNGLHVLGDLAEGPPTAEAALAR